MIASAFFAPHFFLQECKYAPDYPLLCSMEYRWACLYKISVLVWNINVYVFSTTSSLPCIYGSHAPSRIVLTGFHFNVMAGISVVCHVICRAGYTISITETPVVHVPCIVSAVLFSLLTMACISVSSGLGCVILIQLLQSFY